MAPCDKKKELKKKLMEYNSRYHQIDIRQMQLKALIIIEDDDN